MTTDDKLDKIIDLLHAQVDHNHKVDSATKAMEEAMAAYQQKKIKARTIKLHATLRSYLNELKESPDALPSELQKEVGQASLIPLLKAFDEYLRVQH